MDDPQKHHAMWKQSDIDTIICISYDYIYLKFYKRQIYSEEKISGYLGLEVRNNCQVEHENFLW